MKHSNGNDRGKPDLELPDNPATPALYNFSRTPEQMLNALRKVKVPAGCSRVDEAIRLTEDICRKFKSAENAVDFAIDYMTCLLTVPRFTIYALTTVYMEMRCWLPYHTGPIGLDSQILLNRHYKPVGIKSEDWVKYEEFHHLHSHLKDSQLKAFAWRPEAPGFLFNDGRTPWSSRKNAEQYLERLYLLKTELVASS